MFYSCKRSLLQSYSYLLLTLNSAQHSNSQYNSDPCWRNGLTMWSTLMAQKLQTQLLYRHHFYLSYFFKNEALMRHFHILLKICLYVQSIKPEIWPTMVMYLFPWTGKVMHTLVNCVPCHHTLSLGSCCTVSVDDHSHFAWSLSAFSFLFLNASV